MTFVHKDYVSKIKIAQEQQLQLKMKFLLSYNMKIIIYWGRDESYVVGIKICRGVY